MSQPSPRRACTGLDHTTDTEFLQKLAVVRCSFLFLFALLVVEKMSKIFRLYRLAPPPIPICCSFRFFFFAYGISIYLICCWCCFLRRCPLSRGGGPHQTRTPYEQPNTLQAAKTPREQPKHPTSSCHLPICSRNTAPPVFSACWPPPHRYQSASCATS